MGKIWLQTSDPVYLIPVGRVDINSKLKEEVGRKGGEG